MQAEENSHQFQISCSAQINNNQDSLNNINSNQVRSINTSIQNQYGSEFQSLQQHHQQDGQFPQKNNLNLQKKAYSAPTCSICLEDLAKDLQVTKCGHVFHAGCVQQSIEHNAICPLCRHRVQREASVFQLHMELQPLTETEESLRKALLNMSDTDQNEFIRLMGENADLRATNQKAQRINTDLIKDKEQLTTSLAKEKEQRQIFEKLSIKYQAKKKLIKMKAKEQEITIKKAWVQVQDMKEQISSQEAIIKDLEEYKIYKELLSQNAQSGQLNSISAILVNKSPQEQIESLKKAIFINQGKFNDLQKEGLQLKIDYERLTRSIKEYKDGKERNLQTIQHLKTLLKKYEIKEINSNKERDISSPPPLSESQINATNKGNYNNIMSYQNEQTKMHRKLIKNNFNKDQIEKEKIQIFTRRNNDFDDTLFTNLLQKPELTQQQQQLKQQQQNTVKLKEGQTEKLDDAEVNEESQFLGNFQQEHKSDSEKENQLSNTNTNLSDATLQDPIIPILDKYNENNGLNNSNQNNINNRFQQQQQQYQMQPIKKQQSLILNRGGSNLVKNFSYQQNNVQSQGNNIFNSQCNGLTKLAQDKIQANITKKRQLGIEILTQKAQQMQKQKQRINDNTQLRLDSFF